MGHGADMQSKVKEIEELNHSFRNRDKMKDDAIAQLSDQLMAISTRLQELERKQQPYIQNDISSLNRCWQHGKT